MILRFLIVIFVCVSPVVGGETASRGALIYRQQCVECHGAKGEGVEDGYDEPLYGSRSIVELAKIIHKTMPEEEPELCEDADAEAVARYIHEAFYSEEARARNLPVRIDLARLTADQHLNSAADLVGSFRRETVVGRERGLEASYYEGRDARRDKRKLERVDPQVGFTFGAASPVPDTIGEEAFAISWRGALMAPRTGTYEIAVRSENGFKLFLNADSDVPLLDGWVSSGMMREERAMVFLLGGRAYPMKLEFFKYKDKTASIDLRWKPPYGVDETIPNAVLSPERASPVMVVTTKFPADDSSMGYARGTGVSKAWQSATIDAAIEVADHVVRNLEEFVGKKPDDPAYEEQVRAFSRTFVDRAFRDELSDDEDELYVNRHFAEGVEMSASVKRIVVLALASPRFLIPENMESPLADTATVASRLALYLHDSLPSPNMRKKTLTDAEAIRLEAESMLDHPLTRVKIEGFFHHWLHIEGDLDLSKDPKLFPEFDEATIAEMRRSLNRFLEDVVWSESSDYRQLLLADYLYLNGRLADFMGKGAFEGSEFRKIHFDPQSRAGVLTHPYLLARFAYHQTTSPIHRGVFVTRNVLGRSLKPPPEAVKFEDSRFDPHLTMREKVTELTKSSSCMTCHSMINPLGFSLEHFDAVGRYRFEEKQRPIEAGSDYETPDGATIPIRGARDVAVHAATNREAQRGFIEHLFEHLIKQPANAYGLDTVDRLHDGFVSSGFHMKKLIVEIVTLAASHRLENHESSSSL